MHPSPQVLALYFGNFSSIFLFPEGMSPSVPLALRFVLTEAQAQDHWLLLIPDTSMLVLYSGQGLSRNSLTDKPEHNLPRDT